MSILSTFVHMTEASRIWDWVRMISFIAFLIVFWRSTTGAGKCHLSCDVSGIVT